jgi:hypothetical protein
MADLKERPMSIRFEGPYAAAVATLVLCTLMLYGSPYLHAQTADAAPFSQRHVDDVASSVVLAGDMATHFASALVRGHANGQTLRAALCDGGEISAFNVADIGLKKLLAPLASSQRPDGSGSDGAVSGHSGNAVISIEPDPHSGGWWFVGSLVMAAFVIEERGRADKHSIFQRVQGIALGGVTRWGWSKIPACRGYS